LRSIATISLIFMSFLALCQSGHPNLILTQSGVVAIRKNLGTAPLFDQTLAEVRAEVDAEIAFGIDVPIPADLAGGYTHERHKTNFFMLQKAGALFQITGEEKYAIYVRDMFLAYKEMYPKIGRHPEDRSYATGKIFWQCLNDANWLVYASQAYDCIYDWLSPKERKALNAGLFRPMADFLSVETPQFFNRIHNHSTWGNAAVGMIGLVMDDKVLIDRALYGAKGLKLELSSDNDGGLIALSDEKMGFMAQIDDAFSPDGYYIEGPYYQRYAMYPFLIFAQALNNKRPDLKIFSYRDSVLLKGVEALLNQTNSAGEFFAINDAQKGMSYKSRELVSAVGMSYLYAGKDARLLSVAQEQQTVSLDEAGMTVAKAIADGKAKPFVKSSLLLRDGANGDEGALGILRGKSAAHEATLVMKYTKHGMGHGHFDILSFTYFIDDQELFQDYGAARWVNIEQKDGGGYLKENQSWAKQTVAHNTLVVDGKSQFEGNVREADKHHPITYFFSAENDKVQVMSAKDTDSYAGVSLHRTMVMIQDEAFENPLVLDLFEVASADKHTYELPFYFKGDLMQSNIAFVPKNNLTPAGESQGYQHLWMEATGKTDEQSAQVNWFKKDVFYTLTTASVAGDEYAVGRIGANDPNFNLRRDPVLMIKRSDAASSLFASVLEVHGTYSPVDERPINPYGIITKMEVLVNTKEYTVVRFGNGADLSWEFALANNESSTIKRHEVKVGDRTLHWTGAYQLSKLN
jgi:oligo-alginate lyase